VSETFFSEGLDDRFGTNSVHVEGLRLIERRVELVEHELSQ
jgi:hypothetical protein